MNINLLDLLKSDMVGEGTISTTEFAITTSAKDVMQSLTIGLRRMR